ncbi:MAG: hypothetical protein RSA09_00055 [Acinetobacter sp.]
MRLIEKLEQEILEKQQGLRSFYMLNNSPCRENPNGWISSFAENEYYNMLADIQALKNKRVEILFSNIRSGLNQNQSIHDVKKIRENSVTSSTYERSQRLMKRKLDLFYGIRS